MGIKERREREKQELRGLILETARELFVEQGYEQVSMRKIADRIEYSPTAIYLHFKDKESLLIELCQCDFRTLAEKFHTIARVKDPIERLRQAGHAYARFGFEHPNQYRMMFMTPHPQPAPGETDIQQGNPNEDAYAFLQHIVGECIEQKLFRREAKDLDMVAQTIWAGIHGVVSLHIMQQNNPWIDWRPVEKTVRLMIDVLIDGLLDPAVRSNRKSR